MARGSSHSPRSTSRISRNSRSPGVLWISSTEAVVASTSNPFDGEAGTIGRGGQLRFVQHQGGKGFDHQRGAASLDAGLDGPGANRRHVEALVLLRLAHLHHYP